MTWRTHALVGVNSLWLLGIVPQSVGFSSDAGNIGLLAAAAAFGALLPDLDAQQSRIKHLSPGWGFEPFFLPSVLLHQAFGHRGLLHSALGLALFSALVAWPAVVLVGLAAVRRARSGLCQPPGRRRLHPYRHSAAVPLPPAFLSAPARDFAWSPAPLLRRR